MITTAHEVKAGYDGAALDVLDFHASMLTDRVRTEAFMRAIMAAVRPGDVVVEIGTGTGVLALFAAKAGARKVYAIERGPVIELAREIVAANGYEDRIELIAGASTEVDLPERGDLLVTETIGNAAVDEGIQLWVDDARRRLLEPHATIIPSRVSLQVAALELPRDAVELGRWGQRLYTLDFTPVQRLLTKQLVWDDVSPVSVVSEPVEVFATDLADGPRDVAATVMFRSRRDAMIHAIGLWFDADLGFGIGLSNAPPNPVPSWSHGILMLEQPIAVRTGGAVVAEVRAARDGGSWSWRVGDGPTQSTA